DSIKHIVHAIVSGVILRRRMGGFGEQNFISTAFKTTLAAIVMGIFAWGTLFWLVNQFGTAGIFNQVAQVLVPAMLSGGIFLVLAYLLRIQELRWLISLVRKRLQ
ncbi:MAG: hypothetical protein AAF126_21425, partial [Chloroflexota bacterium]